jgi:hypothetical protein
VMRSEERAFIQRLKESGCLTAEEAACVRVVNPGVGSFFEAMAVNAPPPRSEFDLLLAHLDADRVDRDERRRANPSTVSATLSVNGRMVKSISFSAPAPSARPPPQSRPAVSS